MSVRTLDIIERVFPSVFAMLEPFMDTPEARAELLTIGLQESRLKYRVQLNDGPAHGLWQFEPGGGVLGVLNHPLTRAPIGRVCEDRGVEPTIRACYAAIVTDDILACAFARLLLYTLPAKLPHRNEASKGWDQYIEAWRPGLPHRDTWDAFFAEAWEAVTA